MYDKSTTKSKLQIRLILAKTAIFRAIYPTVALFVSGRGSYGFTHEDTAQRVMNFLKTVLQGNDLTVYFVVYEEKRRNVYLQYLGQQLTHRMG